MHHVCGINQYRNGASHLSSLFSFSFSFLNNYRPAEFHHFIMDISSYRLQEGLSTNFFKPPVVRSTLSLSHRMRKHKSCKSFVLAKWPCLPLYTTLTSSCVSSNRSYRISKSDPICRCFKSRSEQRSVVGLHLSAFCRCSSPVLWPGGSRGRCSLKIMTPQLAVS
jgi:hypothetical protein